MQTEPGIGEGEESLRNRSAQAHLEEYERKHGALTGAEADEARALLRGESPTASDHWQIP